MEKLLEKAKEYFDANKDLKSIYVCEDGNVFYKEAKAFCFAHCVQNKTKEHLISREDVIVKKETKQATKATKAKKEESPVIEETPKAEVSEKKEEIKK